MKYWVAIVILVSSHTISLAQCLAPYYDLTNQLYVYDNGETHFVDPLRASSLKVGRYYLAYINQNQSRLRLYYGGKSYTVAENNADYWATDNWFVFKNYTSLGVLYKNELKTLDRLVYNDYWIGDSAIAWVTTFNELKVFYGGETKTIEYFPLKQIVSDDGTSTYSNAKMGDNIFAYITQSNQFKVLYHGEVISLETYEPSMYLVDRDMVIYYDFSNNLKIFSKGKIYETNLNGLNSFWSGEGFLVYYTLNGQLAIWSDGQEKILAQDRPRDLLVQQNMVAYTDKSNNFYVWYAGKVELLDRYAPMAVKAYRNLLVYQDSYGRLKGYYYGRPINISDQIVSTFDVYNETVTYSLVRGEVTMWCHDKSVTLSQ